MANKEMNPNSLANLRPLSPEQARINQAKGWETRKKKEEQRKTMQETCKNILKLALRRGDLVDTDEVQSIAEMEDENITVQEAIMISMVQKAIKGDTQSAIFIRDTLGEKPIDKVDVGMSIEDYVKSHKVKF